MSQLPPPLGRVSTPWSKDSLWAGRVNCPAYCLACLDGTLGQERAVLARPLSLGKPKSRKDKRQALLDRALPFSRAQKRPGSGLEPGCAASRANMSQAGRRVQHSTLLP